jgi:ATP-dependent 26S proteasome regulatory subunit
VRSGRIELWLETRLPDLEARLAILKDHAAALPDDFKGLDLDGLASQTDLLTGADLRRLIEDGKILYAFDKARKQPLKDIDSYFSKAIHTIRLNKEKYAEAEKCRPQVPSASVVSRYFASAMRTMGDFESES